MTEEEEGQEVYSIPEVLADETHPLHEFMKDIVEKLKRGELVLS